MPTAKIKKVKIWQVVDLSFPTVYLNTSNTKTYKNLGRKDNL